MNNSCDAYEVKYNRSRLADWLRLSTWTAQEGICLICDIDPTGAEIRWKGFQNAQGSHVDAPKVEKGQLLTEYPDASFDQPRDRFFEATCDLPDDAWLSDEFFSSPPGLEDPVELARHKAERLLRHAWKLYVRNPEHDFLTKRPPHEYVEWAKSEDIEVPWLAWAEISGLTKGTAKAAAKIAPSVPPAQSARPEKVETKNRKEQEIDELRRAAIKEAVKLKHIGVKKKHITAKRICEELLDKKFSDGRPFASRWATVDGMRSHLKGEHNPTKTEEFRTAKSDRGEFNR